MKHTPIKTIEMIYDISDIGILDVQGPDAGKFINNAGHQIQAQTATVKMKENGDITVDLKGYVITKAGDRHKGFTYLVSAYGYSDIKAQLAREFEARIKSNSEMEKDDK